MSAWGVNKCMYFTFVTIEWAKFRSLIMCSMNNVTHNLPTAKMNMISWKLILAGNIMCLLFQTFFNTIIFKSKVFYYKT